MLCGINVVGEGYNMGWVGEREMIGELVMEVKVERGLVLGGEGGFVG